MRIFPATRPDRRSCTGRCTAARARARNSRLARATATEDGFLLIEVMISALLVALIVVGTLNGFDAAGRAGAELRARNEAAVLAAESQEALRSDPASTFNGNKFSHVYTREVNGTKFTITQSASFLNSKGETINCSALETSRQEANSVKIVSSVAWPQQVAAGRLPLVVSGTSTPPNGSALEIDVGNYPTPTAGIAGVTSIIKYTPSEAGESSVEGTTEGPGCIVFSNIPAIAATVEFDEKLGYVTPSDLWKIEPKEVAIAPNYTTHYPIVLNEGGAIKAEFTFKGSSKYTQSKNTSGTREETAGTDLFVAYNGLVEEAPHLSVGGPGAYGSGGTFTAEPGQEWAHTLTTPKAETKYPNGNLFPFPEPTGAWKVFAGACKENEPKSPATAPSAYVLSGKTTTVTNVPLSYVKLNVYKGKEKSEGLQETTAYPVTITNTACKGVTPNGETELSEPKAEQKQTINSGEFAEYGGHLEHPFLPFGSTRICLAYNTSGGSAKHLTFTVEPTLTEEKEYVRNILLTKLTSSGEYSETNNGETYKVVAKSSGSTIKCP
jgi:Tfp pilus assembly protein PilV